ncbi:MAG: hypothetical protein GC159_22235 [Phycisphaera sp.]|nr:hypothetical protein [Phycisphaera sp.]
MDQVNRSRKLRVLFPVSKSQADSFEAMPIEIRNVLDISWEPLLPKSKSDIEEIKLQALLKRPVVEIERKQLTVRQIILLAANQGGGVHRSELWPPELNKLATAFPFVGSQLGHLMASIAKVLVAGLWPLREVIIGTPPTDRLVSHHSAGVIGQLNFSNEQYMEGPTQVALPDGLHVAMLIHQASKSARSERVYLDLSSANNAVSVRLSQLKSGGFRWAVRHENRIWASVSSAARSNRYEVVQLSLVANDRQVELGLRIANDRYKVTKTKSFDLGRIDRIVLGADQSGKRGASFSLKDMLVYNRAIEKPEQDALLRYMRLNYA